MSIIPAFGLPTLNLIIALREHDLPIEALNKRFFSKERWRWIEDRYEAPMILLVDEARKLEGK